MSTSAPRASVPGAASVSGAERATGTGASTAVVVAVLGILTVIGLALRLRLIGQSLFADEFATYFVVSSSAGPADVVSAVHGDIEITPPLYFVLAWLTTRVALEPEWLRAGSLLAGTAAIPLVYLVGVRTVGRAAALTAAALTALSPFMLYYSADARGYQVAVALSLVSTWAMLSAAESGRARWWALYSAASCAAVYTHYTVVFVLGAQLAWLLWAFPRARRPALLANLAALIAFLPWTSGLLRDFHSPTAGIVDIFNAVTVPEAGRQLSRWALGYAGFSYDSSLWALPGALALALLGVAVALAAGFVIAHRVRDPAVRWAGLDRRLVLVFVLAIATPAGEALFSVVGTDLFSARYFATSWPAFALTLAALLAAPGPRLRVLTVALAVAAFALGAGKALETRFMKPDYRGAADFIAHEADHGDILIDATSVSPAPLTPLAATLEGSYHRFEVGRPLVRYGRFKLLAPPPSTAEVTRRAAAAANGHRVFVVSNETLAAEQPPSATALVRDVVRALPPRYHLVAQRTYPGGLRVGVMVFADRAS